MSPGRPGSRLPAAERMVAFTDAAVAIALTLLVLPLVDIVTDVARDQLPPTEVLTGHLSAIGGFLLSFAVIGRFWMVHHRLFGFASRLTPALIPLNLLWILSIAVLPIPTEMLASFDPRGFVMSFYLGVLLVCSSTLSVMTMAMRSTAVADGAENAVPEAFVVGSLASTTTTVIAFVVSLTIPAIGPWAFFILLADPVFEPMIRRLRARRESSDRPAG